MAINILGVRIDLVDLEEALTKVRVFLNSNKQNVIFTPNPEMLVDSQDDKYFHDVLNSSDLNVCDGTGLYLASFGKLKRIPGVDLMLEICKIAEQKNKAVYVLGTGDVEVLKKTKEKLNEKFTNLKIVGTHAGPKIKMKKINNSTILNLDQKENDLIIDDIILNAPDILFVAFGHNKQEKWIAKYINKMPSIKIAVGVGGAFDYISDYKKRAPKIIQKIGLEWLFRLVKEPKRIKRIFKAIIIFPILCLVKHK
ncbi:WecB/TagA/CpsF family glycosyltransferase [Patescibacteria group bacterium]|nr:WecB/TagA/CpsF family glycosyltransferase [Patescibacteria group bacterium]MBU1895570.1 WecB/TagA/CpsF family glycosyltransferase [Patescibacteria group bacterium]